MSNLTMSSDSQEVQQLKQLLDEARARERGHREAERSLREHFGIIRDVVNRHLAFANLMRENGEGRSATVSKRHNFAANVQNQELEQQRLQIRALQEQVTILNIDLILSRASIDQMRRQIAGEIEPMKTE
ncbi:hypothetical protein GCK72_008317 [Caenorhabditis remanei]|uniref:Uncharacterized protein n=1 Tax=Caenorhabditis remanei TaxID=31234 RepID=A0A6A5GZC8_CAERE|nr:hypothetical protein GCK72_008317 [Caenorhabditis remanei]KAF1760071.1 hypothetical protein GCK72_008317 [Caenorhabditis remanei]